MPPALVEMFPPIWQLHGQREGRENGERPSGSAEHEQRREARLPALGAQVERHDKALRLKVLLERLQHAASLACQNSRHLVQAWSVWKGGNRVDDDE